MQEWLTILEPYAIPIAVPFATLLLGYWRGRWVEQESWIRDDSDVLMEPTNQVLRDEVTWLRSQLEDFWEDE